MVWGVEGSPVKIIYGLMYSGGGTFSEGKYKGESYTTVYNSNNSWKARLTPKEMENVGEIYMKFVEENPTIVPPEHLQILREMKLKQIADNNE